MNRADIFIDKNVLNATSCQSEVWHLLLMHKVRYLNFFNKFVQILCVRARDQR